MQPMAVPPPHSANAATNGKLSNANQINKEVQFVITIRINQYFLKCFAILLAFKNV